ncbi:MAG: hypothetical protein MHM6MM_000244 [Cercozoa sp. M6MM]
MRERLVQLDSLRCVTMLVVCSGALASFALKRVDRLRILRGEPLREMQLELRDVQQKLSAVNARGMRASEALKTLQQQQQQQQAVATSLQERQQQATLLKEEISRCKTEQLQLQQNGVERKKQIHDFKLRVVHDVVDGLKKAMRYLRPALLIAWRAEQTQDFDKICEHERTAFHGETMTLESLLLLTAATMAAESRRTGRQWSPSAELVQKLQRHFLPRLRQPMPSHAAMGATVHALRLSLALDYAYFCSLHTKEPPSALMQEAYLHVRRYLPCAVQGVVTPLVLRAVRDAVALAMCLQRWRDADEFARQAVVLSVRMYAAQRHFLLGCDRSDEAVSDSSTGATGVIDTTATDAAALTATATDNNAATRLKRMRVQAAEMMRTAFELASILRPTGTAARLIDLVSTCQKTDMHAIAMETLLWALPLFAQKEADMQALIGLLERVIEDTLKLIAAPSHDQSRSPATPSSTGTPSQTTEVATCESDIVCAFMSPKMPIVEVYACVNQILSAAICPVHFYWALHRHGDMRLALARMQRCLRVATTALSCKRHLGAVEHQLLSQRVERFRSKLRVHTVYRERGVSFATGMKEMNPQAVFMFHKTQQERQKQQLLQRQRMMSQQYHHVMQLQQQHASYVQLQQQRRQQLLQLQQLQQQQQHQQQQPQQQQQQFEQSHVPGGLPSARTPLGGLPPPNLF